jgi:hypothetical protein
LLSAFILERCVKTGGEPVERDQADELGLAQTEYNDRCNHPAGPSLAGGGRIENPHHGGTLSI